MEAARRAGAILLERWSRPVSGRASKTTATDEVSDADHASEAAIVEIVRREHPDDAIVAEEGSNAAGRSGRRWLVDPLDGTINYLYRIPQWSVSIACLDRDGPLVGVVLDPVRGELFFAQRGQGAWLRPMAATAAAGDVRALSVTTVSDPALALLASGFSYDSEERREQARREGHLVATVRDVRRFGSAALDLAWVACGRIDVYLESVGSEWDWAAGRLLVTEAGGTVSEVEGVRAGVPGLLASGPRVHDALLALVTSVQREEERMTGRGWKGAKPPAGT